MRYVYECRSCKESWEEDHPVKDRDVPLDAPCPKCSSGPVVRTLHPVHFKLKGSGWAKDGYASCLGDHPKFKDGSFDPSKDLD